MKLLVTKMQLNGTDLLFCGLMDGNRLIEVRLDDSSAERLLGNIYVGKVQRIVNNLNAAFVDIAPGLSCYLSLSNLLDPVFVKRQVPGKIVKDDEILVQVCREAIKSKAPALSTNLNFPGRYAVLTSENRRIGVSAKLDDAARNHYMTFLNEKLPKEFPYGVIVRTNASGVPEDELLSEILLLSEQMDRIAACALHSTCFSCLYRTPSLYQVYLQTIHSADLEEIVTDLPDVYEELSVFCKNHPDLAPIPLHLYEDEQFPLVSLYNLNREMMRATAKEVRLKSGGSLIIETTEAMTVIDVNTGRSIAPKNREEHFFLINLEAAREIALQLRLRNLSGIIIVDFIDLESPMKRQELLAEMRLLVKNDPFPVLVHDTTALQLVEITRKKALKSLSERIKQLTMPNPL